MFVVLLLTVSLMACQEREERNRLNMTFSLSADSTAIRLGQLPEFVISELITDSSSSQQWNRIFAVYEQGNETQPLTGTYRLDSTTVQFLPDAGFEKGKTYLAECYIRDQPYKAKEMVTGHSQLFKPKVYRQDFEF